MPDARNSTRSLMNCRYSSRQ